MKSGNGLILHLLSAFAGLFLWATPVTVHAQACSTPHFVEQRFPTNTSLPEETR